VQAIAVGNVDAWPANIPSQHTHSEHSKVSRIHLSMKQIVLTGFSNDLLNLYLF
jgi:hypothetical protein